ncbi:dihydrofolate reductase [Siphonobacter sp. SORGH_AS_0500]|uniref:dihydrofolate reductase n=1 Tax=Siphonobacter sp. SORGH_AS_0500 TaxID=1864824 RepID=UPI00285B2294|nr:dihydrofolate reductase [Siphonobacter sp. SORGH_AS_0500]MDR6196247.1 dihydrofolate reductase [Siphonobacter sp. SORGH_AS_0500]
MVHLVVAVAENGAIGKDNQLIWHLPDDLKQFKKITSGHTIVMGRKTYESIGKPLPNRTNVIITRNPAYQVEGCLVVTSLQEAMEKDTDIYVIGGAEIYAQALPATDVIHLTEVHMAVDGDAFFPKLDAGEWVEVSRESHSADEKHAYSFDFVELRRSEVEKIQA